MVPMVRAAVVAVALIALALPACKREQKGISETLPAARATKARADAQAIADAVRLYQATFGSLPESIEDLTEARTEGAITGGPYLAKIPAPPTGFTPYQYVKQDNVNFTITSTAGAITVTAP